MVGNSEVYPSSNVPWLQPHQRKRLVWLILIVSTAGSRTTLETDAQTCSSVSFQIRLIRVKRQVLNVQGSNQETGILDQTKPRKRNKHRQPSFSASPSWKQLPKTSFYCNGLPNTCYTQAGNQKRDLPFLWLLLAGIFVTGMEKVTQPSSEGTPCRSESDPRRGRQCVIDQWTGRESGGGITGSPVRPAMDGKVPNSLVQPALLLAAAVHRHGLSAQCLAGLGRDSQQIPYLPVSSFKRTDHRKEGRTGI